MVSGGTMKAPRKRKVPLSENQKDYRRLTSARKVSAGQRTSIRRVATFSQRRFINDALTDVALVYRGNSMFDPDLSGTGLQPVGFDENMALYENYRVHGSKIKVTLINDTDSGVSSNCIVVYPTRETIAAEGIVEALAQPGSKSGFCLGLDSGRPLVTINHKALTTTTYRAKSITNSEQYAAAKTASPLNEWYWQINLSKVNGATLFSAASAYMLVEMLFDVEYFNPLDLDLS